MKRSSPEDIDDLEADEDVALGRRTILHILHRPVPYVALVVAR